MIVFLYYDSVILLLLLYCCYYIVMLFCKVLLSVYGYSKAIRCVLICHVALTYMVLITIHGGLSNHYRTD